MATLILTNRPLAGTKTRAAAYAAARILLGLIFAASGLSGYIMTFAGFPPPPMPGIAGEFQTAFFGSHWVLFVDGVEFFAGAMLLANRLVPLALGLLAAVIANIFAFHFAMAPSGLPAPFVLTGLWLTVAQRFRATFAPFFVWKL